MNMSRLLGSIYGCFQYENMRPMRKDIGSKFVKWMFPSN